MRALAILGPALATLACGGGGGGGGECGPGSASATGLAASGSGIAVSYGGMTEGPNGDCPPSGGSSVISVTIMGSQVDGAGYIAFCVPQPNELGSDLALGSNAIGDEPQAILEDFAAEVDGCLYNYDPTQPTTGTVHATGICDDGAGSAGFALTVEATLAMAGSGSACPAMDVSVQLAGTIAVPSLD